MKQKFLFIFIISFSLFFKEATAKTIYSILIADTINENEFATKPDMQAIQGELHHFCRQARIPLKEKVFLGSDFKRTKIESYLTSLKVDSSDTIVFYFSGHGYRTQDQKTPWPCLNFEFYQPGIDLKWVVDCIRQKRAQFALIMADCCNNFMDRGFDNESKFIQMNLPYYQPYYPGYQPLLLNSKGCLVVCSSSIGQFSYGSKMGGLFTQCFLSSLTQESHQSKPNWKLLIERASSYIKDVQKPIYAIYQ
jgi:hypothetical protein